MQFFRRGIYTSDNLTIRMPSNNIFEHDMHIRYHNQTEEEPRARQTAARMRLSPCRASSLSPISFQLVSNLIINGVIPCMLFDFFHNEGAVAQVAANGRAGV